MSLQWNCGLDSAIGTTLVRRLLVAIASALLVLLLVAHGRSNFARVTEALLKGGAASFRVARRLAGKQFLLHTALGAALLVKLFASLLARPHGRNATLIHALGVFAVVTVLVARVFQVLLARTNAVLLLVGHDRSTAHLGAVRLAIDTALAGTLVLAVGFASVGFHLAAVVTALGSLDDFARRSARGHRVG